MRLVQFWVPDVRQPAFAARIRRQCRTIAAAVTADEQAMLDAYEREAGVLPGWR
ncbi:MAG: antitoxin MazE-like protein [Rhizomicrobium sp.]